MSDSVKGFREQPDLSRDDTFLKGLIDHYSNSERAKYQSQDNNGKKTPFDKEMNEFVARRLCFQSLHLT